MLGSLELRGVRLELSGTPLQFAEFVLALRDGNETGVQRAAAVERPTAH